ncbi:hypothetical protein SJR62_20290 [Aeromonas caviae]|nr:MULTISPECIES: hypothetical protein [Aeromonas]MDX7689622.1 hypothetical protein [Aeromonas caviae]MDX7772121.1 hypothetical protein [Aeromonas caviae]MDX7847129.1 hypothetical protein [Aeromonas caviae]
MTIRKVWFVLAACAAMAVLSLILYGWRQGGLALLQLDMGLC